MAEHILGLLLVTQSSRDRHVFRYPPDPTSPSHRLSAPVYSRATYTAQDNTMDSGPRLKPGHGRAPRSRGTGPLSRKTGSGGTGGGAGASGFSRRRSEEGTSAFASASAPSVGSVHSHLTEYGSECGSSSSSDSSDYDGLWEGTGTGVASTSSASSRRGRSLSGETERSANGPRPFTELNERASVAESDTTTRPKGKAHTHTHSKEAIEAQYGSCMGYSLEFLGDLLSPSRRTCNRKFEISVDDLVFVGHPVSCGPDGKWSYPADESDDDDDRARRVSRGRRMEGRDASLRAVAEQPESPSSPAPAKVNGLGLATTPASASNLSVPSGSTTEVSSGAETPASRPNGRSNSDNPELSMFHLVLVLDKPDPQASDDDSDPLDEVYREIAFKWTAAAFALQVRDNWVATQVRDLARIREKCIQNGIPVTDCLRRSIESSPLAASIHELFSVLHKIKGRPMNNHFQHLSTTAKVTVGNIPITINVQPTSRDAVEEDSSDSDSDDEWGLTPNGLTKQSTLRVEPWKTLLILDVDESERSRVRQRERRNSGQRRGSREMDEEQLVDQLIQACDVSKPLSEIAHQLRCDLEGIIIPLARELAQNKRAVLIDVINIRLRTILVPTAVSQHVRSITQHCVRFSVAFPKLPPLLPLIAMLSAQPVPFRDLLPPDAQADPAKREPWLRAITWLLRNDLVQQAHVRARVIASGAVKEAAWKRLWHRRRRRWLRARKESVTSATGSGRSRPSFGEAAAAAAAAQAASPNSDRTELAPPTSALATGWPTFAARVPRTPLAVTRTLSLGETLAADESESDFEMDSDVDADGGEACDDGGLGPRPPPGGEEAYAMDRAEPDKMPAFGASFIFHPARAQKDEARWLRVVRERTGDPVVRSRFDLCVQYFDGVTTFEEITFRTGLSRRELDRIAHIYRDDLMITIHP